MTKKNTEITIDKKLFNTLNSVVDSSNVFSNKRLELTIIMTEISLGNLQEYKLEQEEKTHHISDKSQKLLVEKIYNKFLKKHFDLREFNTGDTSFKKLFRSHYQAMVDVALLVQLLIGNFHNASSDIKLIPFCKIVKGNDNQKKSVDYNSAEGVYYDTDTNWKLYIRNSAFNLVDQKVKDRISIEGVGYKSIIANYNPTLLNVPISDLIKIANTVVNYATEKKETDQNWQTDTLKNLKTFTSDFGKRITDKDFDSIFKGEQSTQTIYDFITSYVKLCVAKNQYEEIFGLISDIHMILIELSKTNKDLKAFIENKQYIFAYQKGMQDNLKHQLVSNGLKLVA